MGGGTANLWGLRLVFKHRVPNNPVFVGEPVKDRRLLRGDLVEPISDRTLWERNENSKIRLAKLIDRLVPLFNIDVLPLHILLDRGLWFGTVGGRREKHRR